MSLVLLLAFAVQAETVAPSASAYERIDFDLARYRSPDFETGIGARRCRPGNDPSVITVCGRRGDEASAIGRLEGEYPLERFVADTRITGNLRGGVYTQAANLDPTATDSTMNHNVSNRITVGLRLGF